MVAQQDHLDRHLRPLTDVTLRRITLRPGQRVLDVGCGAVDFTFAAAALVQPGGSVTGIDFAEPMLALARRRAAERAVTAVGFVAADIETWQPDAPYDPYDAAVSRLGMPPTAAAMSSVRNALVPGGRFAFTCFRGVLENQRMVVPTLAVMEVMPFDLPDPAASSGPFALADPDQVRRLLGGAGFDGIELTPVDYQVEMTGADGAVDMVLSVGPASAEQHRTMPPCAIPEGAGPCQGGFCGVLAECGACVTSSFPDGCPVRDERPGGQGPGGARPPWRRRRRSDHA